VNAVEVFVRQQEIILANIPNKVAGLICNASIRRCSDKSATLFFKITLIVKWQAVS